MTGRYFCRSMRNIASKNPLDRQLSRQGGRPDRCDDLRFTKNYDECCVMLRAIAPRHVNVWLNLNCYAL